MMLIGLLATAFYAAQTELVGQEYELGRQQHRWLADVEFYSQGLVLLLQVFCTGRLMTRLPAVLLLVSLPVVSIAGLGVWWLAPTALAIFVVQIVRRGAQFALEKPAREVLYTPLDLATKHKVKFLLDTFAFRLGDLFGAILAVGLRRFELGVGGIVLVTIVFALVWIVLGFALGRERRAAASAAAMS
jgi:AAA family ATP:ADP antiporter